MRRTSWLATLLVCAALAVTGLSQPTAQATSTGVEFGANATARSGETQQAAVLRLERTSGSHLDVVREFLNWDSPFPASFDTWLRDTDHTLILSVKSHTSRGTLRWADIAAAQPGSTVYSQIEGWADKIKGYGVPIYFAFNHEPESGASSDMGTPADFVAAWRKIHDVFAAHEVTNVKFIWIMTAYSFQVGPTAGNYAPKYFPGDDYVDAMGIDAYNSYTCHSGSPNPWKTLEQIIKPFRDFGAAHPDKELWLTEWASTEDPANPTRKAQWFAQAQALFKRSDYAQFQGISAFDKVNGTCKWVTDSSSASLAAFAAMATDPFYNGGITPPPPPPPPSSDLAYVASAGTNTNQVNHTVQIPSTVQAGDTLLLFFTANQNPGTTTGPAGWTQIQAVDPTGLRGRVWMKTATASDAGSMLTVRSSVINKADLSVAAYRGTGGSPVDVQAVRVQTTNTTSHPAPSVTPTQEGDWVVVYWADKSSTNTRFSIPASLTQRRAMTGSSGGHITVALADTGQAVPVAPTDTYTAIGTATGSPAVAYTIAFRPAS
jgi:hypothetical protein